QFDIDDGICKDDYGQQVYPYPDLDAVGTPSHFTRDYDNRFMRVWPIPHLPGVLHAQAIVLPQQLYAGMPLPFSARQDLDLLLMWMKKLAYAKHDADKIGRHSSELQSRENLVCRLLLEKKKTKPNKETVQMR